MSLSKAAHREPRGFAKESNRSNNVAEANAADHLAGAQPILGYPKDRQVWLKAGDQIACRVGELRFELV